MTTSLTNVTSRVIILLYFVTIARYISEINLKLFACAFVDNSFDPAKIASKLRELGDDYDEKVIQPLMKNVQRAAADQVSPNGPSSFNNQQF